MSEGVVLLQSNINIFNIKLQGFDLECFLYLIKSI